MFRKGDTVKELDGTTSGIVLDVKGKNVTIENDLGFEEIFQDSELILVKYFEVEEFSSEQIKDKIHKDNSAKPKPQNAIMEVDLHYGHLDNYDKNLPLNQILIRQMNYAREKLDEAISKKYAKIIFIHGKGKGILETELKKLLDNYAFTYYDADFKKYKLGATEVDLKAIKQ